LPLKSKYFTHHRIQKHSQPRFLVHYSLITLPFVLCTLSYRQLL
jgi:hypothetical protein